MLPKQAENLPAEQPSGSCLVKCGMKDCEYNQKGVCTEEEINIADGATCDTYSGKAGPMEQALSEGESFHGDIGNKMNEIGRKIRKGQ
jgi:hypothetical protein